MYQTQQTVLEWSAIFFCPITSYVSLHLKYFRVVQYIFVYYADDKPHTTYV